MNLQEEPGSHYDEVSMVSLTPDGGTAVSASNDGNLRVWDVAGARCCHVLEGHENWVTYAALSSDGQQVLSVSDDHTLRVWDIKTGGLLQTLEGHQDFIEQITLTRNDSWLVSACSDGGIRIWDWVAGTLVVSFFGDNGMETVACTRDCVAIVAGDSAGKLHFLQLEGLP